MSKRKSIVSAFGDFQTEQKTSEQPTVDQAESEKQKPNRVAAGIVGTTQRTLTQIREERDQLLEEAKSSSRVIQIDPQLIDPSPFRDRLPDDDSSDFEAFKKSISEEQQKVPITVRQHPEDGSRFQVVYGHRRWRALRELGQQVNAIIADLDDRDLVIAQGIENASRQDLSWIERALFAYEMQSAGIKPRDIKAALSIDDAELSKLRSVVKAFPASILETIGRAPGIGRPRWLELAGLMSSKANALKLEKTLSADKVLALPSDERFMTALGAFSQDAPKPEKKQDNQLNMALGDVGSMTSKGNAIKINLAKQHSEGFRRFLEGEMKGLLERYQSSLGEK